MTTADWALVISIMSAAVSVAGFVWNVWSKFIYPKPQVRVSFGFMDVIQQGTPTSHVLSLSATNLGPGPVTLYSVIAAGGKRWWGRHPKHYGMLNPLHNYPAIEQLTVGPFGGGLPKKIDVGEQFTSHFVADHESLADDKLDRIGFTDTFGRHHWAAKGALAKARPSIRRECERAGKDWRKPAQSTR